MDELYTQQVWVIYANNYQRNGHYWAAKGANAYLRSATTHPAFVHSDAECAYAGAIPLI